MPLYMCTDCRYQSDRQYNVHRHERRIHLRNHSRICCGELLYSKADYYAHCEQNHPEVRARTYISRKKYRITANSAILSSFRHRSCNPATRKRIYNIRLRKKYTRSIRTTRKDKKMQSKLRLKYSVTYNKIDIENIPLIFFLKKKNSKKPKKSPGLNKIPEENDQKAEEELTKTVIIPDPSEGNMKKTQSESHEGNESKSDERNESEKVSDSLGSISLVQLPTKKLILQRFQSNVQHEFGLGLRESNNNNRDQGNIIKKSTEPVTRVIRTCRKNFKNNSRANKENLSYAISVQQELDIKLDKGITVPLATQLHRDFLATIDFESYKIF